MGGERGLLGGVCPEDGWPLPQPRGAWVARLGLLLLALACAKEEPPPPPPPPVTVAVAERGDLPDEIHTIGTVEARNQVGVQSRVGGELVAIGFHEGDWVEAGQLLFQIDPRPFENAVAMAKASLERDRAQERFARREARRFAALARQGAASAQMQQARQSEADAAAAAVRVDLAQLADAELSLGYATIRAPFAGRTGQRNVDVGAQVQANDATPLVTLVQTRPIDVRFAVPSRRLPAIRAADVDTLPVRANPRGHPDKVVEGVLTFVDNAADPATGTITLKATFENEDETLWPGIFVDVLLFVGTYRGVVVVPTEAVQVGPDGPFVFVVREDSHVEQRPVRSGIRVGERTMIEEGLEAGERVVTDGHLRLRDGIEVQVREGGAR